MRVAVNGATGTMGQAVVEAANERDDVSVAFGITPSADRQSGMPDADAGGSTADTDAGGTDFPRYPPDEIATALVDHDPDAVVDFSVPEATAPLAVACAEAGTPLVVGTTGRTDGQQEALDVASSEVPVLQAANFSRGIQALLRALGPAIEALPSYDIELLETHHNRKQDAPSGTAKTILDGIADHRPVEPVYGREGAAPREEGEVGVFARRAGDVRGEHEVLLAGNDEVLTLRHRVEDRAVFAAGALDAAEWVAGRDPGQYDFGDVIGEEATARDGLGGDDR